MMVRPGIVFAMIATLLAVVTVACDDTKVVSIGTPTESATPEEKATRTTRVTSTPKPTRSPSPAPTLKLGSREAPVPVGTPVTFSNDWAITVVSATPDGTGLVMQENPFNSPPEAGHQFFLANISATYSGAASETFDGSFSVVGPSAVAYATFDAYCGVVPDEFPTYTEVFPGGTIQGNVCWSVTAGDAAALDLYYEPLLSALNNEERVYWRLTP